jgi:uncharacterized repeat protein (TIGR01451 family)
MERIHLTLLLWLAQLMAVPAFAANDEVAITMRAFKVVPTAKGTELVPTESAQPGDTIEYQVTYRNAGDKPARDVTATLPVPAGGMAYVQHSAAPATALASLDGKQFAAVPLQRTVVRDGRRVTEAVPAAEYRFLRWTLGELRSGESTTVKSRMRLDAPNNKQQ